MTFDEISKYMVPALKNIYGRSNVSDAEELYKLLNSDEYDAYTYRRDSSSMSEDHKRLLTMLAGPHWQTVLRAYQIQHNLKQDKVHAE